MPEILPFMERPRSFLPRLGQRRAHALTRERAWVEFDPNGQVLGATPNSSP